MMNRAAAEALERELREWEPALDLHHRDDRNYCTECSRRYPCDTVRQWASIKRAADFIRDALVEVAAEQVAGEIMGELLRSVTAECEALRAKLDAIANCDTFGDAMRPVQIARDALAEGSDGSPLLTAPDWTPEDVAFVKHRVAQGEDDGKASSEHANKGEPCLVGSSPASGSPRTSAEAAKALATITLTMFHAAKQTAIRNDGLGSWAALERALSDYFAADALAVLSERMAPITEEKGEFVEGCWTEQGGVHLRIERTANERVVIVFEAGPGGRRLAAASIAQFRRQRIADAIAISTTPPAPVPSEHAGLVEEVKRLACLFIKCSFDANDEQLEQLRSDIDAALEAKGK